MSCGSSNLIHYSFFIFNFCSIEIGISGGVGVGLGVGVGVYVGVCVGVGVCRLRNIWLLV